MMIFPKAFAILPKLLALSFLGSLLLIPVSAQNRQTNVVLHKKNGEVQRKKTPNGPWRDIQEKSSFLAEEKLLTGGKSKAELWFRDKNTLLRQVSRSVSFYKLPCVIYLERGQLLKIMPKGGAIKCHCSQTGSSGGGARTCARGTALIIRYKPEADRTEVLLLTNSQVTVSAPSGSTRQLTRGGHRVVVEKGEISPVEEFDLELFYETTELALGLGPGVIHDQAIEAQTDSTVRGVVEAGREETLQALRDQKGRQRLSDAMEEDLLSGEEQFGTTF